MRKKWKQSLLGLASAVMMLGCAQVTAFAGDLVPVGRAVGIDVTIDGVMVAGVSEVETENGKVSPAGQAGVLPGEGVKTERLVRFGYHQLTAQEDGLLLRRGETVPVHEFHYWDSTANGSAFASEKGQRHWRCGYSGKTLHAAFPHLYFAGRPELAERFVTNAAAYGKEHRG